MNRSTTAGDAVNKLLDFCPLNYTSLRTQTPRNLEILGLASISSISPPETPENIVVWRLNSC